MPAIDITAFQRARRQKEEIERVEKDKEVDKKTVTKRKKVVKGDAE